MVQLAIRNYYKFFDETIQSSTFIVLMITALIFAVGLIIPTVHAQSNLFKGNILEFQNTSQTVNTIVIDGVEYKIYFERVR